MQAESIFLKKDLLSLFLQSFKDSKFASEVWFYTMYCSTVDFFNDLMTFNYREKSRFFIILLR